MGGEETQTEKKVKDIGRRENLASGERIFRFISSSQRDPNIQKRRDVEIQRQRSKITTLQEFLFLLRLELGAKETKEISSHSDCQWNK